MHELSIAQSLITSVIQEKEDRGLSAIRSIGLRIGALSGVLPDALRFSFEAAREDTPLEGTELKIEEVKACGKCRNCDAEFEILEWAYLCPECSTNAIEITNGYELDIVFIEAETSPG